MRGISAYAIIAYILNGSLYCNYCARDMPEAYWSALEPVVASDLEEDERCADCHEKIWETV